MATDTNWTWCSLSCCIALSQILRIGGLALLRYGDNRNDPKKNLGRHQRYRGASILWTSFGEKTSGEKMPGAVKKSGVTFRYTISNPQKKKSGSDEYRMKKGTQK